MKKLEKKKRNLELLNSLSDNTIKVIQDFNKSNGHAKKFIKDVLKINPYFWDYGFLISIEKAFLTRMMNHLKEENLFVGVERECQRMQTCLNLLEIVEESKSAIRQIKDVDILECIDPITKIFNSDKIQYEVIRYVNVRNAKRYLCRNEIETLCGIQEDSGKPFLVETVYREKAWALYHKMKAYWMKHWWS